MVVLCGVVVWSGVVVLSGGGCLVCGALVL